MLGTNIVHADTIHAGLPSWTLALMLISEILLQEIYSSINCLRSQSLDIMVVQLEFAHIQL